MVKHCCYKDCNKDTRYHPQAVFIPFVKPKTDRKRCLRWVHLCGREKSDFNVDKVNYVSFQIYNIRRKISSNCLCCDHLIWFVAVNIESSKFEFWLAGLWRDFSFPLSKYSVSSMPCQFTNFEGKRRNFYCCQIESLPWIYIRQIQAVFQVKMTNHFAQRSYSNIDHLAFFFLGYIHLQWTLFKGRNQFWLEKKLNTWTISSKFTYYC